MSTPDYTDEQLSLLRDLASEAEGFFNYEVWSLNHHDDDPESFGEEMRAFLEDDDFSGWAGDSELEEFKARQAAGGVSNRAVLLALWGESAFGVGTTEDDRRLIAALKAR